MQGLQDRRTIAAPSSRRPLHRVHSPPAPGQGAAQTAAQGSGCWEAPGQALVCCGGHVGSRCAGSARASFLQGVQKKRPWDMQSALLRRHLLELTQSFIIPLVRPGQEGGQQRPVTPGSLPSHPQEHYMASLMPLQKSITPWKVGSRGSGAGGFCLYPREVKGGIGIHVEQRWGGGGAQVTRGPSQGREMGRPRGGGLTTPGGASAWEGPSRDMTSPVRRVPAPNMQDLWGCAPQAPRSPGPCLRPLPRSAPSVRRTSCGAWSMQDLSSPVSSRATGWASTGG